MNCASIMSRDPPLARVDESVGEVVSRLSVNGLRSVTVVDAEGRYAGMFGMHDLLCLLVPRVALAGNTVANLRFIEKDSDELRRRFADLKTRRIGEVIDRAAPTLRPDTSVSEALRLACHSHGPIPVVEEKTGKVAGVVAAHDLLRAMAG